MSSHRLDASANLLGYLSEHVTTNIEKGNLYVHREAIVNEEVSVGQCLSINTDESGIDENHRLLNGASLSPREIEVAILMCNGASKR